MSNIIKESLFLLKIKIYLLYSLLPSLIQLAQ